MIGSYICLLLMLRFSASFFLRLALTQNTLVLTDGEAKNRPDSILSFSLLGICNPFPKDSRGSSVLAFDLESIYTLLSESMGRRLSSSRKFLCFLFFFFPFRFPAPRFFFLACVSYQSVCLHYHHGVRPSLLHLGSDNISHTQAGGSLRIKTGAFYHWFCIRRSSELWRKNLERLLCEGLAVNRCDGRALGRFASRLLQDCFFYCVPFVFCLISSAAHTPLILL